MASHFTSIGVPDGEDLDQLLGVVIDQGEVTDAQGGERVVLWTDAGSGASVAVTLAETGALVCAKPHLAPTHPSRVRFEGLHEDPECAHCSVLVLEVLDQESGEELFPLAVEVPDLAVVRPALAVGGSGTSWVSGIAHEVDLFADEASYLDSVPDLAVRSLIPTGLFTLDEQDGGAPPPVRAEASFSGVLVAAEQQRNETSGGWFWHLVVDTHGLVVDVAVDPDLLAEEPAPGMVCSVDAWLIARVTPAD